MENRKPLLYLVGKNASALNVAGMVVKVLKASNDEELSGKFWTESLKLDTIDEVLRLAMTYVEVH